MFTVHGTRKLLDRVKAPVAEARQPTTLLGNWYGTALFWKPRQVALLVNEKTLLPVFVPLAPASSLGNRVGESVGLVLEALGVGIDVVLQETTAMANVSFAKTANRSVVGSMNEFAYHAEFRNAEGLHDLTAIALDLADMPCGPLFKTYVTPRDALRAAIAEATDELVPEGTAACQGHIVVHRSDVPASIEWRCSECADAGTISGWQGSPFDLRQSDCAAPGAGRRGTCSGTPARVQSQRAGVAGETRLIDAAYGQSVRIGRSQLS